LNGLGTEQNKSTFFMDLSMMDQTGLAFIDTAIISLQQRQDANPMTKYQE
jgi:hypothetical protein